MHLHCVNFVHLLFQQDKHFLFNYITDVNTFLFFKLNNDRCTTHVETSQLISFTNQLKGFYMRKTLVVNGKRLLHGF